MKAGIYKRRDNGKHIYVSKDRSIRAFQLTDCHPLEAGKQKVSCSEKEQVVSWPEYSRDMQNLRTITADRVADIPNGTTDHAEYLMHYLHVSGAADVSHVTHVDQNGRRTEIGTIEGSMRRSPGDAKMDSPAAVASATATLKAAMSPEGAEALFQGTDTYAVSAVEIYAKDPGVRVVGHGRVVGMPRALGIGYGAESLLKNAADVRAADAGVPEHVASKIRDDFREVSSKPTSSFVEMDFSKIEARVSAHFGTFYDAGQTPQPGDVLIRFADQGQQVTHWVVRGGRLLCAHPRTSEWAGREVANLADVLSHHARPRVVFGDGTGEITVGNPVISAVEFDLPRLSRFEQQMLQERNAAMWAHEMMAKAFFAEALGIVEIVMDEIIVLDGDRWETLESDVRAGRYVAEAVLLGMGISDRQTGEMHLVEARKARYIASTSGFRIGGTLEEPTVIRTADLVTRYHSGGKAGCLLPADEVPAIVPSGYDMSAEEWWAAKVRSGYIRLIGKQSKRKHRRAGHRVFWCAPLNSWAWEVRS